MNEPEDDVTIYLYRYCNTFMTKDTTGVLYEILISRYKNKQKEMGTNVSFLGNVRVKLF